MKGSKTRAFYIETMLLTFLLLLTLTILVRVYGAAGERSLLARRKTKAALIVQNVVSMFEAGSGDIGEAQETIRKIAAKSRRSEIPSMQATMHFSEQGILDQAGEYRVQFVISGEHRNTGVMITGTCFVYYGEETMDLASIDTAKFVPYETVPEEEIFVDGDDSFSESYELETETEEDYSRDDILNQNQGEEAQG